MLDHSSDEPRNLPRHRWLYALAECRLPSKVTCAGRRYTLLKTFKHDFFAATGLYEGPRGLAVLKVGRSNPVAGVPFEWLGRYLTRREARHYELLRGTPGVPNFLGTAGRTGFMHEFVPGRVLGRRDEVRTAFFDELETLLDAVHGRDMAYVDLNKRQNIIVGDDGKPYLIDFQISAWLPRRGWRGLLPVQWLLHRFQRADRYHFLKHKRRIRPDLLTDAERAEVERLSIWIRLHRAIARPITQLRRRTLRRVRDADTAEVAGSTAK